MLTAFLILALIAFMIVVTAAVGVGGYLVVQHYDKRETKDVKRAKEAVEIEKAGLQKDVLSFERERVLDLRTKQVGELAALPAHLDPKQDEGRQFIQNDNDAEIFIEHGYGKKYEQRRRY